MALSYTPRHILQLLHGHTICIPFSIPGCSFEDLIQKIHSGETVYYWDFPCRLVDVMYDMNSETIYADLTLITPYNCYG